MILKKAESLHPAYDALLLVYPGAVDQVVIKYFRFVKEKTDFPFSTLWSIRAVDDVLSDCQAAIPADSTWCSLLRVGCSNYKACCINDVFTFKHHCKYWPRSDEIHQFPEEWLILVFLVMCFGKIF